MSFLKLPLVVPLRLAASIAHIIISSLLLLHRNWNLIGCGHTIFSNPSLLKVKDDQFIIVLSLMIGLCSLELISLGTGLSIYSNFQSLVSFVLHSAASVALLFLMFNQSCVDNTWPIFGVCSCLPFITEIATIIRLCGLKKLPIW